MSEKIQIDRFTRLKQSVSGKFSPGELPRLAEYLAGTGGEIHYSMTGSADADATGRQTRRVKCIISGWFLLADPATLKPERQALAIESWLVVVRDESQLPPLEAEADDEDYIVCGDEMDVLERIEEEVLLNLPANAVHTGAVGSPAVKASGPVGAQEKVSPFAVLAKMKKKY
jgi:uncharacterized metal-binding protein YceD (DUF177 family)